MSMCSCDLCATSQISEQFIDQNRRQRLQSDYFCSRISSCALCFISACLFNSGDLPQWGSNLDRVPMMGKLTNLPKWKIITSTCPKFVDILCYMQAGSIAVMQKAGIFWLVSQLMLEDVFDQIREIGRTSACNSNFADFSHLHHWESEWEKDCSGVYGNRNRKYRGESDWFLMCRFCYCMKTAQLLFSAL